MQTPENPVKPLSARIAPAFNCIIHKTGMLLGNNFNFNPIHYCPKTKTGIINNHISLRALYTRWPLCFYQLQSLG